MGRKSCCPRVVRRWQVIYHGIREVRKREISIEFSYAKEDLADVRLRLFFPSSKVFNVRWEIPGRMSHMSHRGVKGGGKVAGCHLLLCPQPAFCSLITFQHCARHHLFSMKVLPQAALALRGHCPTREHMTLWAECGPSVSHNLPTVCWVIYMDVSDSLMPTCSFVAKENFLFNLYPYASFLSKGHTWTIVCGFFPRVSCIERRTVTQNSPWCQS